MKPNSNPSISDELCWDFFVGGDHMNYYKVRYDSQLLAA